MTDPAVHVLRNAGDTGLPVERNSLMTGKNSGYQAIVLAYLAGAARVVLLAYDMHYPGGVAHWHPEHPLQVPEEWYVGYAKHFAALVDCGMEIVNATPGSALKCFPRMPIEEALA